VPTADFFARLGLFVIRGFLDRETCARLRTEAGAADKVPGAVGGEGSEYRVDVRSRSTGIATVSPEAEALIAEPLSAAIPDIARHFSVEIEGRQSLQFLVYGEGDFFEAHRDRNDAEEAAAFSKRRRVSVVMFLNGEAKEPAQDTYDGGALTFYGLLGGERGEQVGLPLIGEPGLLVAFRSDMTHAVTPITRGERYTVVTWLV
jgi:predicted 2-oxoglutarate/Fe(II)-dependent dioxygenase YbiX